MKIFRPINVFTAVAVVLAFAFVFRLVNVVTFRNQDAGGIGLTTPANAGGFSPSQLHAPPPDAGPDALTQEDLDKAVKETARKADETEAPAAHPAASGTPAAQASPDAKPKGGAAPPDNSSAMPPPPDDAGSFSASEVQVLQDLAKRRDDLNRREKNLSEREALLSAAEQEVDHKIAELNKLKGELEALLGQQQNAENTRIDSLVKIYEGMKPKEAATIFNTLDMEVLLPVISRMSERKSGPILASMDPEKARIVTIRLAQQRELPQPVSAARKALQAPSLGQPPVQPSP